MTAAAGADPSATDYRDPEIRLRALFDTGTLRLLAPRDDSGVRWARGEIEGTPAVAYATDSTEFAVMGASAAVNILHRKKLAAAPHSEREALRADLVEEQLRVSGGVNRALEIGVVDEVIKPHETHRRIAEALAAAPAARSTHGNIPL